MLKLYYSPGACSLASHILLEELGIPYEAHRVDLKTHQVDNQDFYQINPLGTVPTLELDNGDILTQNLAILIYLGKTDQTHLLLPSGNLVQYLHCIEWLGFLNSDLHKTFGVLFSPQKFVQSEAAQFELKKTIIQRIHSLFDYVEKRLSHHYLVGDHFTIVDAYLYVMCRWGRAFKIEMTQWPKLTAFTNRIAERPSTRRALAEENLT